MRPFTEPPAAATVPDWLCGLWRRRSIRFADGRHDDTTVGRSRGGAVPWEITLSTLPHRQGQSLLETDRPS